MKKNKEVKYGCYVEGEVIDNCVMDGDYLTILDCSIAANLSSQGKTKEDCEFWRPLICPKCGYSVANPSQELIERARQLIKDLIKFTESVERK